MRKTLMVSVAVAALLAATGFATAQGVNQGAAKGSEAPAAASPKGDTAAPMNAPAAKGADTSAPAAASKEAAPQHAQGKPDAAKTTTGEMKVDSKTKASDSTAPASKDLKNPTAAETKPAADSKTKASDSTSATTPKDMKNPTAAETKPTADSKTKASDSTTPTSKDSKNPTAAESKPATSSGQTTGNAATSATAAPPAEKRTQISSAIKQEKVEEVTNVNFSVSIGTAVPAGVRYHPMPSRIVEIYPEWRGYDFILVRGQYIVLRPHTHEIVYIIEG
jgi:hypothetical protein